jgi:hypothetical protein
MDLKTEFENKLSDLQRELFRESDTAYYTGYSEFLEQRLEARQRETLVMWRSAKKELPNEDELVVTVSRSKCVRFHIYASNKKYNEEKHWEAEPFPDWITHWGRLDKIPQAT